MTLKPYRLFPDLAEAGLYGAFIAAFIINITAPLYGHVLRLVTDFSFSAFTGLLALPAQIFLAALSSIMMALAGIITALPALLLGVRMARWLQGRGEMRLFVWLGAGGLLGLANFILLFVFTALGEDGIADMIRACALYGGGGVGAAFFLWRKERERIFYNH